MWEGKMSADATEATHLPGDDRGKPPARQVGGATRREFLANLRSAAAVTAASGGLALGEAAALSVLSDQSNNYVGENFNGFTITKFDGTTVTV
jgi:hypothetical protein